MRRMMAALRGLGTDARRRYEDLRRPRPEVRPAELQDALSMFDYDGRDDPC